MVKKAVVGGKKKHKPSKHLAARPKKAPSAYNAFVKEYFRLNKPPAGQAKSVMKKAATKWNTLTDAEKRKYGNQAARGKHTYDAVISLWKQQRNALKRPTNAFGYFVRQTWAEERHSGRSVPEIGQLAGMRWRAMNETQRAPYEFIHQDQVAKYRAQLRNLDRGGRLDLNWKTIRTTPLGQIQQQHEQEEDSDEE